MTLYLVRHGKARKGGKDRLRPLTARGVRDIKSVAAFLKPLRLRVTEIWHSDRVRAIQTTRIIVRAIGSGKMIEQSDLGPDDSIIPTVRRSKGALGDLMIVGHQPFLGKLALNLLSVNTRREIIKLATSSVLALNNDEGKWVVQWLLIPVLIR